MAAHEPNPSPAAEGARGEMFDRSGLAGHPRGLGTLFFTELWERFSYYGLRALLTLFMVAPLATGGLGLSVEQATRIYGTYLMSVYMLSIAGGTIADSLLGQRLTVLVGAITIALGHFAMAVPTLATFYLGLMLIALGTGLLKPNISAMVGQLYHADDPRREAGFSIFYMGINLGAFIAPFVTGFLASHSAFKRWLLDAGFDPAHSWHWGFGAAGVGMVIGIVCYLLFGASLQRIGARPIATVAGWSRVGTVLVGTALLWVLVWLSDQPAWQWLRLLFVLVPVGLVIWFGRASDVETRRLAPVFALFLGAVAFWALFEQAGSSLNLFAERFTQERFLGIEFPAPWYQSANPIFVILLAPLFAWLWNSLGHRQPSSPAKFVVGLLFLAASFAIMIPAARLALEGRVSPLWLLVMYFLQTVGEMWVSPVGLSTFSKLSPPRLVGAMMGIWFLATAFGNKLAGVLAGNFGEGQATRLDAFFRQQALAVAGVAVVLALLVPWLQRRMGGVR
ncbi:MAG TPA: peptide MFS transporter [Candidatus Synoicihabitans sp.]|nr:peptide MFS transporter [Candidatus Synoicihabitans sp.]